jgi:Flp pilus assembly protein TadG
MAGLIPSFRAFSRAKSGLAAIEFALILPFMALLYFGAIEISLLISADRKVSQTASSLADLVARVDSINPDGVNDVFSASRALFQPYDSTGVEMRVTSVIDKDGAPTVDWSQAQGMDPRHSGDAMTLDPGVLPSKGSVIMAEVTYNYQTVLGFFLKDGMVLNETFYLRPRMSDTVAWSDK